MTTLTELVNTITIIEIKEPLRQVITENNVVIPTNVVEVPTTTYIVS